MATKYCLIQRQYCCISYLLDSKYLLSPVLYSLQTACINEPSKTKPQSLSILSAVHCYTSSFLSLLLEYWSQCIYLSVIRCIWRGNKCKRPEETHWLGPVSISQLAPLYILCITVSIALKVTHTGNNFWKPFLEKTCQADGLWGGSIKWYCILNVSIL